MARLLALIPLLWLVTSGHARGEESWFAVYLNDLHVGHMHSQREANEGRVETRTQLQLSLQRNGQSMPVFSREVAIETKEGRPLSFSSEFRAANTHSQVEALIDDQGVLEADITQAGQTQTTSRVWPRGALLAEAQRQRLLALSAEPGAHIDTVIVDPTSLQALRVRSETLGYAEIVGENGPRQSLHVRQRVGRGAGAITSELWLDPHSRDPLRQRLPALGLQLELRACSRRCATAPPQPVDVLLSTLVQAPRALGVGERRRPLRYRLQVEQASPDALAAVPGQHLLTRDSSSVELLVDVDGDARQPPTGADLSATRWLQSDDPEVIALAEQAVGRQRDPYRQMLRLERAVREHIATRSLRIAYASASEVLKLREGDCTEHAVLLAALARSRGIPSRIVTGLAYTARFGERKDVFVPHAWVVAWVDGNWRGFDAALPAFDAGHIGLTVGNGDPFDFYSGMDLLGRLQLTAVDRADARALAQTRAAVRR